MWVEMKTGGSAVVSQGRQGTLKVITGRGKNESLLETLEAEGPFNTDFRLLSQSYKQLNLQSLKLELMSTCRAVSVDMYYSP